MNEEIAVQEAFGFGRGFSKLSSWHQKISIKVWWAWQREELLNRSV